ncbi:hypothetical protein [Sphingomonas crocodyli]|uniref:Uncharacterized protein n=1 Tax=Sphingomonas crocodyli TaxID=1979270 RepID=A0A437M806_9SPHN|nr:hypothetical protein [Sphingomonas crocodyli]RVT93665.1 hypothetical protein EOD43_07300 [Sphingomonas crocodyli]
MQSDYAIPTLILAALTIFTMIGERVAMRRRVPGGRPGLIPWSLLTILLLIVTAFLVATWVREG